MHVCMYVYKYYIYVYPPMYMCMSYFFQVMLTPVSGGIKMLWLERPAPRTDVNEGGRELL